MTRRIANEQGTVSIVLAAGALLLATFALAVADFGSMLVARARAQTAADAAARAAVVRQVPILAQDGDPAEAARQTAAANGAELISCECRTGEATATVEVAVVASASVVPGWRDRRVRARARAGVDPDVLTYHDTG
jgi:secretion/DNA translocation related TadE-like protein